MSKIKLEVGKTYRNRKGEEVRIIEYDGCPEFPYKGSNGEWFSESGRCGVEDSEDLIEELTETRPTFGLVANALTATRYTFDIPEGVKKVTAKQEGNRIIVEMVPEKGPKPGDVMVNNSGNVYIFKEVVDNFKHKHYAWVSESGRLSIGGFCEPGRPATPEEAQPLWDTLKKAGKLWNSETMQVERVTEWDRILEWVGINIKDGYYNQEDVAEAIADYLEYKTGKNIFNI